MPACADLAAAARTAVLVAAIVVLPASAPGYPSAAEIVSELNRLRTDPTGYAQSLRTYRRSFESSTSLLYTLPGEARPRRSLDGTIAVDEAIAALDRLSPVAPLRADAILQRAARTLADEQAVTGAVGHRTAGAATPGERLQAAGGDIYASEAVSYGATDAAGVVRQLVVDDGVPGRGHRRTLFSPELRFAGVWCGPHARLGAMCAIDLSAWPAGKPRAE